MVARKKRRKRHEVGGAVGGKTRGRADRAPHRAGGGPAGEPSDLVRHRRDGGRPDHTKHHGAVPRHLHIHHHLPGAHLHVGSLYDLERDHREED
jgi:hypothetical protein